MFFFSYLILLAPDKWDTLCTQNPVWLKASHRTDPGTELFAAPLPKGSAHCCLLPTKWQQDGQCGFLIYLPMSYAFLRIRNHRLLKASISSTGWNICLFSVFLAFCADLILSAPCCVVLLLCRHMSLQSAFWGQRPCHKSWLYCLCLAWEFRIPTNT